MSPLPSKFLIWSHKPITSPRRSPPSAISTNFQTRPSPGACPDSGTRTIRAITYAAIFARFMSCTWDRPRLPAPPSSARVAVPRQMFADILSLIARLRTTHARMRGHEEQLRQVMRGEPCLRAGKGVRVSVSALSTASFGSPLARDERDLALPSRSKERSWPQHRRQSGECGFIRLPMFGRFHDRAASGRRVLDLLGVAVKPVSCPLGLPTQPLKLAARPADDIEIDPLQGTQLRLVEVAVVVDPAANARVVHLGQVLQGLVTTMMKRPAPNCSADGRQRLRTGGGQEARKGITSPSQRFPRPE